jgi:putative ABC transport system permease protein
MLQVAGTPMPAGLGPRDLYVRSSGEPEDWTGEYVNGPDIARVLNLPVAAGSLADLVGTGTVAVPAGSWRLGQIATL